jgi:membrane carboxypeptidase/penicillin-binding protein
VAYATFANGGTRYAPEVASEIVNSTTGQVVRTIAPEVTGHVNLAATPSDPPTASLPAGNPPFGTPTTTTTIPGAPTTTTTTPAGG